MLSIMLYFLAMKRNMHRHFFIPIFFFIVCNAHAENTAGKETYQQYCSICHAAGLAGAPKFQNANDWKPRISKGIDGLLKSVDNGLNAMPPKGTCTTCTNQQLKDAIEYMLPSS